MGRPEPEQAQPATWANRRPDEDEREAEALLWRAPRPGTWTQGQETACFSYPLFDLDNAGVLNRYDELLRITLISTRVAPLIIDAYDALRADEPTVDRSVLLVFDRAFLFFLLHLSSDEAYSGHVVAMLQDECPDLLDPGTQGRGRGIWISAASVRQRRLSAAISSSVSQLLDAA